MGAPARKPAQLGSVTPIRRSARLRVVTRTSSTPSASVSTAENWQELAECLTVDPTIFHGTSDKLPMSRAEVRAAKAVCYMCPVQASCLEDAIARKDHWGVYGGMTAPERERLRRSRER